MNDKDAKHLVWENMRIILSIRIITVYIHPSHSPGVQYYVPQKKNTRHCAKSLTVEVLVSTQCS